LRDRILFETNNFVVFPGLGQIVEGYLLIITKKHFPSMRDVPQSIYSELNWVIDRTSEILKYKYGSDCIQFEHGASTFVQGGACCIEHAHLHIAPLNVDVSPYIVKRKTFECQNYPGSARRLLRLEMPYLYVNLPRENGSESFLMDATDLPSQYMRQVIAKAKGKEDEWDWNIFLGKKELENCLKKLKPSFDKLKREFIDEKVQQNRDLLNNELIPSVCKMLVI
jgi:diadenosine tetraphosphate (Ap4A) HIT family hydrolase